MTTNTKIAYWLHDRAAEMIDGDDDAFPDALRALVKRLLLEEKAAAAVPAERKPVAGWVNDADNHRILPLPSGSASAWDGGTSYVSLACPRPSIAPEGTLESAQLAAEDALRAIADQIYAALRGER